MRITMRIKKIFFDKILSGEKTKEYRAVNDYYKARLEDKEIKQIMLHYQKERKLLCDVISITKIPKPERFADSSIFKNVEFLYVLELSAPKLFFSLQGRLLAS